MYYYTYKITFIDGYYYWGSRVSKLPPHKDVYWGSPKTHKDKWGTTMYDKTIINEWTSYEECRVEESILIGKGQLDDPLCLNTHNNENFYTREGGWRGPKPEEWKEMMREKMKGKNVGKKRTPEQMKNRPSWKGENNPMYGVVRPQSTRDKISQQRKGKKYYNNGEKEKCCWECPGEGWVRGRLQSSMRHLNPSNKSTT